MDAATLDARIREAWNEVKAHLQRVRAGEATKDDDPQPRLAAELFEVFLAATDAEVRRKTLGTAAMMWGNSGDVAGVDAALSRLDPDADDWDFMLMAVNNAYARQGRTDEAIALLHGLEQRLTHPRSVSRLHLTLGRHYLRSESGVARRHFEEVLRLAASPNDVTEAEGAIFELDHLQVGQPAPHFTTQTIDGEVVDLSALAGSIVCLDFWSTRCGPCRAEFETLRTLHAEYAPPALTLIGVSSDRSDDELRAVMHSERLVWPQIREEVILNDGVFVFPLLHKLYNVHGVPHTVLIDRDGRIAGRRLRGSKLIEAVRDLITHAEPSATPDTDRARS